MPSNLQSSDPMMSSPPPSMRMPLLRRTAPSPDTRGSNTNLYVDEISILNKYYR